MKIRLPRECDMMISMRSGHLGVSRAGQDIANLSGALIDFAAIDVTMATVHGSRETS